MVKTYRYRANTREVNETYTARYNVSIHIYTFNEDN